jgi:hypothetical protein
VDQQKVLDSPKVKDLMLLHIWLLQGVVAPVVHLVVILEALVVRADYCHQRRH